jgi:oligoendopeptidase F
MTYSGTTQNLFTLAHELGHAYHSYVMKDLPPLVQNYAMNVAETASTFAELIVIDASIKQAKTKEEKIALLDDKLQATTAYFMDIHSRFLFEKRFYEQRKQGSLGISQLCELMEGAQKEGFAHSLSQYHPYFWASKLHFYGTDVPFYNFPYTFGYLFSMGIYARALEEGASFASKYVELLCDTGRMTVEDLAARHLGVDLTQPDFWQSAVRLSLADVDEFLRLTE